MKSLELFVGAGGLALGASRAGFKHVAVIEWDKNACDSIRLNQEHGVEHVQDWPLIEDDVHNVADFSEYGTDLDLVSGGPPCQPFSIGGKHLGKEDERNLFPEAIRAVRQTRPKTFMFENVKGLTRASFHNYFQYIQMQLRYPELTRRSKESWRRHLARLEKYHTAGRHNGLHYFVTPRLLNAANFGVPQKRERVIIVGVRADLHMPFTFPEESHSRDRLLYEQWVTGEYWERHKVSEARRPEPTISAAKIDRLRENPPATLAWRTVRDATARLPKIAVGQRHPIVPNHYLNPGARTYAGHNGSQLDQPAKTLKAGDHGVPGGENTLVLPHGGIRYFSVRECAEIQTFPMEYEFAGSWTESMRQLGNAVPVLLAEKVALELAQRLQENLDAADRLAHNREVPANAG